MNELAFYGSNCNLCCNLYYDNLGKGPSNGCCYDRSLLMLLLAFLTQETAIRDDIDFNTIGL
jgi:hypothetical protein